MFGGEAEAAAALFSSSSILPFTDDDGRVDRMLGTEGGVERHSKTLFILQVSRKRREKNADRKDDDGRNEICEHPPKSLSERIKGTCHLVGGGCLKEGSGCLYLVTYGI